MGNNIVQVQGSRLGTQAGKQQTVLCGYSTDLAVYFSVSLLNQFKKPLWLLLWNKYKQCIPIFCHSYYCFLFSPARDNPLPCYRKHPTFHCFLTTSYSNHGTTCIRDKLNKWELHLPNTVNPSMWYLDSASMMTFHFTEESESYDMNWTWAFILFIYPPKIQCPQCVMHYLPCEPTGVIYSRYSIEVKIK